jgi:hypothetical protein
MPWRAEHLCCAYVVAWLTKQGWLRGRPSVRGPYQPTLPLATKQRCQSQSPRVPIQNDFSHLCGCFSSNGHVPLLVSDRQIARVRRCGYLPYLRLEKNGSPWLLVPALSKEV